jgi:hypothetical protein
MVEVHSFFEQTTTSGEQSMQPTLLMIAKLQYPDQFR